MLIQIQYEPFISYKYLKSFKFGTQNAIFRYFGHMLRLEFAKTNIIYQINTFTFIKVQDFMQKEKTLDLGLKKHYLANFRLQS